MPPPGTTELVDVIGVRRSKLHLWLRRTLLSGAAVVIVVAIAGCNVGGSTPSGDPGNQRLHQLRADPIFSILPPGAHLTKPLQESPAKNRPPGLDGGGQDGPSVIATFTSSQPPATVFSFFARRAATTGWIPTGSKNVLGYPQGWHKPYPGNISASLSLTGDINTAPGPRHVYTLVAALPSKVIQ